MESLSPKTSTTKSVLAVLRDLSRITGRPVDVTGDVTTARMLIVSMIAEAKYEKGFTWAQCGEILGVAGSPQAVKAQVKNIARSAQGELAKRAMATPMKNPGTSACTPAGKDT
jgi:hypothetical protein